MRRLVLIIIGIVIILLLIAVWLVLLFLPDNKKPNEQTFADFGPSNITDEIVITEDNSLTATPEPVIDTTSQVDLRQLTTKPVVGYTIFTPTNSSSTLVRYIEAGTGHVFDIDLTTGKESRVSATTIPFARKAVITPNGQHVLVESSVNNKRSHIVGTINPDDQAMTTFYLTETADNLAVSAANELLYTTANGNSSLGRAHNPITNTSRTLFTLPLREVTVAWHHTINGPHHAYPKPASQLYGIVFSISSEVVDRLPVSGYGLSAAAGETDVLYSLVEEGENYQTYSYSYDTKEESRLPFAVLPEKCTYNREYTELIFCAVTLADYGRNMPNSWYLGQASIDDSLWEILPSPGSATLLKNISNTTGRPLDVVGLQLDQTGRYILFTNRNDQTLWLYDLVL